MKNLHSFWICGLLIFFFALHQSSAQRPEFIWAKSAGLEGNELVRSSTVDVFGDIIVLGTFNKETTFGNFTLNNAGLEDIFLVKYDANGNVIWAKSAGGDNNDIATDITTDALGCLYITGWFPSSTIYFDSLFLTNSNTTLGYNENLFVTKYDPNGNVLWVKSASGDYSGRGSHITADKNGNIYFSGYYQSPSIRFGDTTLTKTSIPHIDFFLVKLDSEGNELFVRSTGGENEFNICTSIAIDNNNNAYLTGVFQGNSIQLDQTVLKNHGPNTFDDIFVAKYGANGNVIWANSYGGERADDSHNIAIDSAGNVFIIGSYQSPTISFGNITLTNTEFHDLFLFKLDPLGTPVWGEGAGNIYWNSGRLMVDTDGGIIATGGFRGETLTFGTETITNKKPNGENPDVFLVKFDTLGNLNWLKGIHGDSFEQCNSIKADGKGNIYVTGNFSSAAVDFDSIDLQNSDITVPVFFDSFIAKLDATSTSVHNTESNLPISVYPNPAKGKFSIKTSLVGNVTISIFSLDGKTVYECSVSEEENNIDFSTEAKGMYFYQIKHDNKIIKSGQIINE